MGILGLWRRRRRGERGDSGDCDGGLFGDRRRDVRSWLGLWVLKQVLMQRPSVEAFTLVQRIGMVL